MAKNNFFPSMLGAIAGTFIAMATIHLVRHPDKLDKLRQGLRHGLRAIKPYGAMTMDELHELLEQCIKKEDFEAAAIIRDVIDHRENQDKADNG